MSGYWTKAPQKGDICSCPACNKALYKFTRDLSVGDKITEDLFEPADETLPKMSGYYASGWYYCPECHYHRWYSEKDGFHVQGDDTGCIYHTYVEYVGFTEKYRFCTRCGHKRWPSK